MKFSFLAQIIYFQAQNTSRCSFLQTKQITNEFSFLLQMYEVEFKTFNAQF